MNVCTDEYLTQLRPSAEPVPSNCLTRQKASSCNNCCNWKQSLISVIYFSWEHSCTPHSLGVMKDQLILELTPLWKILEEGRERKQQPGEGTIADMAKYIPAHKGLFFFLTRFYLSFSNDQLGLGCGLWCIFWSGISCTLSYYVLLKCLHILCTIIGYVLVVRLG